MTRSGRLQRESEKPKELSQAEENTGVEIDRQAEWSRLTQEFDKRMNDAIGSLAGGPKNNGTVHIPYFENIVPTLRQWLSQHSQVFTQEERDLQALFVQSVSKIAEVLKTKLIGLRDKGQLAELYFTVLDYRPYVEMLRDARKPPEVFESAGEGSPGGSRVTSNSSRYDTGNLPLVGRRTQRGRNRQRRGNWRSPMRSQYSRAQYGRDYESDELLDEMSKYSILPPPWNKEPTQSTRLERLDVSRLVQTAGERVFSGRVEDYIKWRDFYIGTLGDVRCLARHKVNALRRALEPLLDTLVDYAPGDFNGYAEIVKSLEKTYGGLFRQMKRYDEYFDFGEKFKYGYIETFREFCRKVAGYKTLLVQAGQKDLFGMPHIYRRLLLPLPGGHIRELQTWLHSSGRPESAHNLLVWAQDRLDRMMTESEVDRRRYKGKNEQVRNMLYGSARGGAPQITHLDVEDVCEEPEECRESELLCDENALESVNVMTRVPDNMCLLGCENAHELTECDRFIKARPMVRRNLIKLWRCVICYTCLKDGHSSKNCKSGTTCRQCQSVAHHTLLHVEPEVSINLFSIKLNSLLSGPKVILPLIALEVIIGNKQKEIYAMIDSGATVSIVSESLRFFFKTKKQCIPLKIATAAGQINTQVSFFKCSVRSLYEDVTFPLTALCLAIDNTFKDMIVPELEVIREEYPYLKDIPLKTIQSKKVEMLIGNDNVSLIKPNKVVSGKTDQPIAEYCPLGWSIRGPLGSSQNAPEIYNLEQETTVDWIENYEVSELLKRVEKSWQLYDKLENTYMTNADKVAYDIIARTMSLQENRIKAGILWKETIAPIVPNNRSMALSRLRSLHKYLEKKPVVKKLYHDNIETWIKEGVLVPSSERVPLGKTNYLSHFPVVNLAKNTTKVRTVVDASAKYQNVSLNDFILAGPNLTNDIRRVLTRFRKNKIAIMGDIKSMFTQIKLLEGERDYHRILWSGSENEKIREFSFTCFTFGNTCSPTIAIAASRMLADKAPSYTMKAKEVIYSSTIIDDSLDSFNTVEEAVEVLRDLKEIYRGGSMQLRKLGSNKIEVLEKFPLDDVLQEVHDSLKNKDAGVVKALGVNWNPLRDELYYDVQLKEQINTRREMLSELAKTYDPLGLITPALVLMKIIIQETWSLKVSWDDQLPEKIIERWKVLVMLANGKITFARPLTNNVNVRSKEVHVFADASEKALGAVAYLRVEYGDGTIASNIIMSRSRVAPLKQISIPRLELQAGVEAAEMSELLLDALKISPKNIFFWTDSSDVIAWLNSSSRSLKVFVANRVGLIQRYTWIQNWKWVPTEINPADMISRGKSLAELQDSKLWKSGPEFLISGKLPQQPKCKPSKVAIKDIRQKEILTITGAGESDFWRRSLNKFSSWHKFVKVCVVLWRKANKIDLDKNKTYEEFQTVEIVLISLLQEEYWPEECALLKEDKQLLNKNPITKYKPFYRTHSKTIHVSGRISNNDYLPFFTRFPLLIPSKSHWSTLIVRDSHILDLKHVGGIKLLISTILQKYFIPHIQIQVKRILRKCLLCQKRKFRPIIPIWAPLPECRLPKEGRSSPFQTVAIDCLGPLFVNKKEFSTEVPPKLGPGRPKNVTKEIQMDKTYILVISCTLYRCTHLELMDQLSTEALLMALDRFIAVRGRPEVIISDNARNFIGTSNLLKDSIEILEQKLKSKFEQIVWNFTTPLDPHKNGVVERIVGLTKDYLGKLTLNKPLTFEQLRTFTKMVESGLNNRPLQEQDPGDREQEPLTPNHFLRGTKYNSLLPKEVIPNNLEAWKRVSDLVEKFWLRFLKQIVPELNMTYRKLNKPFDYKEGQLVLLQENFSQAGINFPSYPMGRIIETYSGNDGIVRSLKIKFQDKEIIRGVSKVSPLFY